MLIDLLSVDQVAEIVGLHSRTIRHYIREGRLKAKKVGKQWRILRRDVDALTGKEAGNEGAEGLHPADRIQATAVVDIRVDDERHADSICNSMLAALTSKGPEYEAVHYRSLYLREERKARLMFWGDAAFIGNALVTVSRISADPDEGKGRKG